MRKTAANLIIAIACTISLSVVGRSNPDMLQQINKWVRLPASDTVTGNTFGPFLGFGTSVFGGAISPKIEIGMRYFVRDNVKLTVGYENQYFFNTSGEALTLRRLEVVSFGFFLSKTRSPLISDRFNRNNWYGITIGVVPNRLKIGETVFLEKQSLKSSLVLPGKHLIASLDVYWDTMRNRIFPGVSIMF